MSGLILNVIIKCVALENITLAIKIDLVMVGLNTGSLMFGK